MASLTYGLYYYTHICSMMRGRIKGTGSAIISVLRKLRYLYVWGVCVFVCYHSSGKTGRFYAEKKVRTGLA